MCWSKKKVIAKLFKRQDSIERFLFRKRLLWNFLEVKIPTKYVHYREVIVKFFKRKDSSEISWLKKRLLWIFLNLKIPTNVFVKKKKKVIVKVFKPKDSNKCVHQNRKVPVKLFKHKDSIQICLLKKRFSWNFLNVKIPKKYVY